MPILYRILSTCSLICLITLSGCQKNEKTGSETKGSSFETIQPTVDPDVIAEEDRVLTVEEMREALGANENAHFEKTGRKFSVALLTNSGAKTLEPLKGQPLKVIDLSQTHITDLSPLEGMELDNIGMAETKIADISALKGMPLKHVDGTRSLIEDISPLAGMTQLTHVFFEEAKIKDITPLKNLPLKAVWLNGCPIKDLSPLENMQLEQLNLCDTPLENLDTVKTMQLGTLWMRNTAVKELAPLANHGLVSLDVQGSAVDNLKALSKMTTLKRLNIADTEVTDLSPLKGLQLERIIFSPSKITEGIDAIREMQSLQGIDLSFDGVAQPMSPAIFWDRYDAGEFKAK
ncbi:hypothetical protein OAF98_05115 [Planctomicrobium sp.]|nr:hypothetical protein [Planctomicrobium sp.]MBT5018248.1 hypothetical protein [Planctomicrobium sp.]MDB4743847.1 hypothetical protein [Planctomicrobium sp.]